MNSDSGAKQLLTLIEQLTETERQIEELTQGRVGTVIDSRSGLVHMLRNSQEDLKRDYLESKTSSDRFSDIFDSLPASAALLDQTGVILSVNESWRAFGEKHHSPPNREIVGANYLEVCEHAVASGAKLATEIRDGLRSVLEGTAAKFEINYPCETELETLWFKLIVKPLISSATTNFLVVHFDITEQKLAEFALNKQVEVLNLVHDAILVVDLYDRITFANKSACDLYGWTRSELLGKLASDLQAPESRYNFEAKKEILMENREWSGELVEVNRKNQKLTTGARWTLIRDRSGIDAILKVHTDLSLLGQFLRAQRMQTIGSITGGVAHDLNNLLTPIVLLADAIKSDASSPHAAPATRISALADQASELIRQLLGFAKGFEGVRRDEQFESILTEATDLLRLSLPKRIKLNIESGGDLVVNCNRVQVHQVIMNLALNARDSIEGEGSISVHVGPCYIKPGEEAFVGEARPGHYVRISVADTGCGISVQGLERIFEPFFSTKPIGQGTGLGLSTCLGIIRSHGGFIRVQSRLGKGSTFSVYLPCLNSNFDEHIPFPTDPNRPTVLVVDDDEDVRLSLKKLLEANDMRVELAEHGDAAIAKVVNTIVPFDLVITDLNMPEMSGEELIASLSQFQAALPVVAISGEDLGERLRGFEHQVIAFVQKPFRPKDLLNHVRRAVGSNT